MEQRTSGARSLSAPRIDAMDRKILRLLQDDAMLSLQEISREIGLSQTPCWKRIQRLLADRIIDRRVAILSPEALGLNLTVFLALECAQTDPDAAEKLARAVATLPEVLQLHRLAAPGQFLLQLVVADEAAYDAFHKRLRALVPIASATPSFVRQCLKATTAYAVS